MEANIGVGGGGVTERAEAKQTSPATFITKHILHGCGQKKTIIFCLEFKSKMLGQERNKENHSLL